MATREQLMTALRNADSAGDSDAAMRFAQMIRDYDANQVNDEIPTLDESGEVVYDYQPPEQPERSVGDYVEGAADAAGIMAKGATKGSLGYLTGAIEGVARALIQDGYDAEDAYKLATTRAAEWTGAPETQVGADILKTVGDATDWIPPVAGVAPAQISQQALRQGARGASDMVSASKADIADVIPQNPIKAPIKAPRSAGAAEVEASMLRQEQANQLPVPIQLTKGQATQDLPQQKFERETAKGELGGDLRDRFTEQNELVEYNLDEFIDRTGTKSGDFSSIETGKAVDTALTGRMKSEKKKIEAAYKAADESPESNEVVSISSVADYLNENMAGARQAPIMTSVVDEVKRLKLGDGDIVDGTFSIGDMTVKQAEHLRKHINKFTDAANSNDLRVARELKRAIDGSVVETGGEPYKRARRLRTKFSNEFQNTAIIRDLTSTKAGTNDRKIALEGVKNKIVDSGSNEDLRKVRRSLFASGVDGKQAWSELQGQVLKDIKLKSQSSTNVDQNGNPIISAAQLARNVKKLDESGKLDLIFGKKAAQQIRDLSDVARDVYVSQAGAVNYSNTSSSIAAAMDLMALPLTMTMSGGLPLPVMTALKMSADVAKQAKTKSKVKEALEFDASNK